MFDTLPHGRRDDATRPRVAARAHPREPAGSRAELGTRQALLGVRADDDRQPGLLLEWRRTAAGWQGRVLHPVLEASGWVIVEDWLSADVLAADQ